MSNKNLQHYYRWFFQYYLIRWRTILFQHSVKKNLSTTYPKLTVSPDFIGFGGPRCGTTWLYENLKMHPELYLPEIKELNYFNLLLHRPLQYYSNFFKEGMGKISGEISPGYGTLKKEIIQYIYQLLPELKLIYTVRNPVEVRLSQLKKRLSLKTSYPFEELPERQIFDFLKNQKNIIRSANQVEEYNPWHHSKILKQWHTIYPAEQILISFHEDIVANPKKFLSRIFQFIGVTPQVDWNEFPLYKKINAAPKKKISKKYIHFLLEDLQEEFDQLEQMFGEKVKHWRHIENY